MELEPGIYHDLPFEDYKALPYVNASAIKFGIRGESMRKMRHMVVDECEDKDSKERKFGRAQHAYVLEGPEAFYSRFLISTTCVAIKKGDGMPCTKQGTLFDGKSWYCGTTGHAPDGAETPSDFVEPSELESVKRVQQSLHESPVVRLLKSKGWHETTLIWDMHGVRCKGRIDRYSEDPAIIIDLKKFDRAELTERNCNGEIASRWYHLQAAFYRMGIRALTGVKPCFMWIFTESTGPWEIIPIQAQAKDMLHGEAWVNYMVKQYAECQQQNRWPGVWDFKRPALAKLPDWIYTINPPEEPEDDGDTEHNHGTEVAAARAERHEPTDEDGEWLG